MTEGQRVGFSAVTEDARRNHRLALEMADISIAGHVAIYTDEDSWNIEGADDVVCLMCGHINYAEYLLAEDARR